MKLDVATEPAFAGTQPTQRDCMQKSGCTTVTRCDCCYCSCSTHLLQQDCSCDWCAASLTQRLTLDTWTSFCIKTLLTTQLAQHPSALLALNFRLHCRSRSVYNQQRMGGCCGGKHNLSTSLHFAIEYGETSCLQTAMLLLPLSKQKPAEKLAHTPVQYWHCCWCC